MRNSLSIENPTLCTEWSDRNLPLTPDMVTAGSSKKVWWHGACGHEWQAIIKNRAGKGCGCPVCSKNLIVPGENDLRSKAHEIVKEWDFGKNKELSPDHVGVQSNYKVFWRCANGHSFTARISDRVKGSRCPFCYAERIQLKKAERIRSLAEEKKQAAYIKFVFTRRKLNQYFSQYMSTPERERIIISLLEKWKEEQDSKRQ